MLDSTTHKKLVLAGIGDFDNPRLWSGSPYNIQKELLTIQALKSSLNINYWNQPLIKGLVDGLSVMQYGIHRDIKRGKIHQWCRSKILDHSLKRFSKTETIHLLHLGSLHFAYAKTAPNIKHYLWQDYTWDLWEKNDPNIHKYPNKLRKHARILEERAIQKCTHFFPISEHVKQNLITHYGIPEERISVVGTGLGTQLNPFTGAKPHHPPKLLFVAKVRFEDKGGPLLIKAFEWLAEQHKTVELTILGQDSYRNFIRHPRINVFGHVSKETLEQLYHDHHLFVYPALNEPWGLVCLEAMMAQMPILGLNKNAVPEFTQSGKFGFMLEPPYTAERLGLLMLKSIENIAELAQKGQAAQQFVQANYGWNHSIQTILKTIDQLQS